jgi:cytochrome d ubiquinol oxidase subunit II
LTLGIMVGVTVVFLPIILAYTTWVYSVLRGRVTSADIQDTSAHHY